jgi:hypothetical protein
MTSIRQRDLSVSSELSAEDLKVYKALDDLRSAVSASQLRASALKYLGLEEIEANTLDAPSPDLVRGIALSARNSSFSSSDDCGPDAYVLAGGQAAVSAHSVQPARTLREPTQEVQEQIKSNSWDHLSQVWPILQKMASGGWSWGANTRCKYVDLRIDTRDGGCWIRDRDHVRISPQQLAAQAFPCSNVPWNNSEVFSSGQSEIEKLRALSVTNIMIGVDPGDGTGYEVYAQSVDQVVDKLTSMGEELEDYHLGLKGNVKSVQLDFDQIGSAGPFPVVDGRVAVPAITTRDLIQRSRLLDPSQITQIPLDPDTMLVSENGVWGLTRGKSHIRYLNRFEQRFVDSAISAALSGHTINKPQLTVRVVSRPESNGKRNWSAEFVRTTPFHGLVGSAGAISICVGECWNRVAYEAERARVLLGERESEPLILDYGSDIPTPNLWDGETEGMEANPDFAKWPLRTARDL